MLGLVTVGTGAMVGISVLQFKGPSVALAAGMTAITVLGLCAFAFQTKYDFSGFGPYLWSAFLVFFVCSLLMMFLPYSRPVEIVYASCGALLFSFYIVYDVQLIAGGKHTSHKFSVDDYCFAALNLYLDIINLFLMLLRLFGDRR
jgi:FtsH-binding integral membrane protein